MKRRLLTLLLSLTFAFSIPAVALAAKASDEDVQKIDARLDGYPTGDMGLKDASGSSVTWMLLFVLGRICLGVMFMNSKRTHLD